MEYIVERTRGDQKEWYAGNGSDGAPMWSVIPFYAIGWRERSSAEIAAEELGLDSDAVKEVR